MSNLSIIEAGRPAHILIAEDDLGLQNSMKALLHTQAGYSLEFVQNDGQFREKFGEKKPDLIILDSRLGPGSQSGLGILAGLETEIPVVFVTGHGSMKVASEAAKNGAFAYLTKPFENERLLKVITRGLNPPT